MSCTQPWIYQSYGKTTVLLFKEKHSNLTPVLSSTQPWIYRSHGKTTVSLFKGKHSNSITERLMGKMEQMIKYMR